MKARGFTPYNPESPNLQTGDEGDFKSKDKEKPCSLGQGYTGFTLIEVLVAGAILGIGLTIIIEGETAAPVVASFDGQTSSPLPLTLAEVSTRADPKTQTFEVTFNMPQPQDFVVLPGMTATVTADLSSRLVQTEASHWVPVSAVVADSALGSRVWVLDAQTMTVRSAAVTAGQMLGDRIEILSGLAGGEEIVSVGASYLAEGMSVSRMTTGEQAVPRAEDTAEDTVGDPAGNPD